MPIISGLGKHLCFCVEKLTDPLPSHVLSRYEIVCVSRGGREEEWVIFWGSVGHLCYQGKYGMTNPKPLINSHLGTFIGLCFQRISF